MPDKNLTNNAIVKALECCSEANNCGQCEYEPTEYQIGTVGCCNELMKDAIDLINRQKEEKETMQHYIDHLQAEVESLQRQLHNAKLHQKETRKIARRKGIKAK